MTRPHSLAALALLIGLTWAVSFVAGLLLPAVPTWDAGSLLGAGVLGAVLVFCAVGLLAQIVRAWTNGEG